MKIVIPHDYQDIADKLRCFALLRGHEVVRSTDAASDLDTLAARLADAEIVVAIRERVEFSRELLARLPKLRLIALVGRSARTIDYAACTELGILVATGKSDSRQSPAEHAIALILASRRNIAREAEGMRSGELPRGVAHRVAGATLGIFGLGAIGACVAEMGRGLGMEVLVWGGEGSRARARTAGYAVAASQADFFAASDVLSLHVRLALETRGIVRADDLARMKPTALLVNTARAELVAPGALLAALRRGRPGFAALDVFEEEPVPPGHPLLALPNVLATPHSAWAEWDNFELYFGEAYEQIVAFAEGRALRLANPEAAARARLRG
ncbi:MAG TPA: D-2-hydroxyacid dehydrogenase family protein [Stellaceae bacterium]|nr:D-2-hydroxyacid dehydrogenase family protein [Stellaceae bacterium]